MKKKETAVITAQSQIAEGVFSMWLEAEAAAEARPGQFLSLYCREGSRILPRPISICEIDREEKKLRIVYRIAGEGTKEFSAYGAGDEIEILGPFGNGFPLAEAGQRVLLLGGGIGVPPMLELAKHLEGEVQIAAGYQDETFLTEELAEAGRLYIATESGSTGTKGNVMDAVREHDVKADVIYACGPTPMLKAVAAYAQQQRIECWISMEERMACGIGACLACVCKSKETDHHTNVNNKRICKDGPVFNSKEVIL